MAVFVLVHGAFQGGWVYSRVARMLRKAGHEVYTPTLTGLGERRHLANTAINLDTHIEDVVSLILGEDLTDVVLCGHSYGGMVITGVAGRIGDRIHSLFYLDAYAPSKGESLFSITGPESSLAVLNQARENEGVIPPIPAEALNVNRSDAAWLDSMCVPQPLATFVQGVRIGVEDVPVSKLTYVFATANGGDWLESTYARLKDDPRWKVHTVEAGHNVMLDKPEELTLLLLAEASSEEATQTA